MTRVLFVDDEPAVLEGLENALRRKRHEWSMEFAEGAKAALELLPRGFDVLVTDMRMPEMDGNELLAYARTHHPEMVRILLTGHSEKQQLLRALPAAHRILAKPCDPAVLEEAIGHARTLRDGIADAELEWVIGGLDALPVSTSVHGLLVSAFARSELSPDLVSEIVEQDVFSTARVLQVGNAVSDRGGIHTVAQAVACLGEEPLRALVADHGMFNVLRPESVVDGFSVEILNRRSVLAAQLTRRMGLEGVAADVAGTAGLLHDIGQYVLSVYLPGRFRQARALAGQTGMSLHAAERQTFGCTHAEVGAHLLSRWHLPEPVVRAVRCHHSPETAQGQASTTWVVAVASELAQRQVGTSFDAGLASPGLPDAILSDLLDRLGLPTGVDHWLLAAESLDAPKPLGAGV